MSGLVGLAIAVAVLVVVAVALRRAHAKRRRGRTLVAPRVGFVPCGNGAFAAFLEGDRSALAASFSQTVAAVEGAVPTCKVLFVYARLAPDGHLLHAPASTLRHLAGEARAAIVVLASPNPPANIVAAGQLPGPRSASLVFTLDRKEDFAGFFQRLFARMATGESMPVAWVALAPQQPHALYPDVPETVFVPEGGAVTFR
jgi:hypothetical protein